MTTTATTVALPKLGTTLFSFTLEMRKAGYTLEGMIDKVAELGLGPGLEIVGFQSLRGYPRVSAQVISSFRDQCERTGLEPSAMSMNLDLGIHRGRLLDEDEALAYLEPQIAVSQAMGFPVCKATVIPTRSFLEGLVRILEKHGDIKFGYEVHSPMAVDSPDILRHRGVAVPHLDRELGQLAAHAGLLVCGDEAGRNRVHGRAEVRREAKQRAADGFVEFPQPQDVG